MEVMVVGGAGFIGSHLVDRLLADGVAVDVVDNLSTGGLGNLAEARSVGGSLKIHHLDVGSNDTASLIGMRQPEVIYHLAAIPRGSPTVADHAAAFSSTVALLEAARAHRVPKVVVALPASSLYGNPTSKELPLKERPLEPRGVRGVMARATIDLLTMFREHDAVEFTAIAFSTIYGSRQRPSDGVVAAFAEAAHNHTAPTIRGDGRQTRDLLFVDDAVDALVRAGSRGSGLLVNVGTGEQTALGELWQTMSGSAGAQPEFVGLEDLPRFSLSPVRARIHLSWSPWTELSDGLRQLY